MAYALGNKCAKNLSKRIVLLQFVIKNVFGTQCTSKVVINFLDSLMRYAYAVWLTFSFPQLFAATLKSIDYNVAMTFILNNNNNNNNSHCCIKVGFDKASSLLRCIHHTFSGLFIYCLFIDWSSEFTVYFMHSDIRMMIRIWEFHGSACRVPLWKYIVMWY